jgi:hypothetical protein
MSTIIERRMSPPKARFGRAHGALVIVRSSLPQAAEMRFHGPKDLESDAIPVCWLPDELDERPGPSWEHLPAPDHFQILPLAVPCQDGNDLQLARVCARVDSRQLDLADEVRVQEIFLWSDRSECWIAAASCESDRDQKR